ncbi:hypothetical protein [Thalassoroseus pseudoceratinae]|uniref:hypothetical protein n=1 Tax=Thalassoroseus pseudoceratinae TaxID=2713176 RepID=UPI00141E6FA0|nr:hypothetical protein [Thalassoroseus pseudoceratinae]
MSDFLTASQRAEYWINSVASIARYAELDNVELAYGTVQTLQYRIEESGEALESRFEELAILSDSQVTFEGFGWHALNDARFPGVWSSAHEAVHGVTIEALEILAQPLEDITDQKEQNELFTRLLSERGHALKISMVEVAKVQERIRRERLKLVGPPPSLLDQVLEKLTPQQKELVEYLWTHPKATFRQIREVRKGWNDVPSDEAIESKFKKIRQRLNKYNFGVGIVISLAEKKVELERLD